MRSKAFRLPVSRNMGATVMSNKLYDALKWTALCVLPALGTLYFALAGIWGLPYGQEVVGTITACNTFLGAILGLSTYRYRQKENGQEDISED